MKKVFLLFIFICLLSGCTKEETVSKYPYQTDEGFSRFFTDEIKAKYPDILEVNKQYMREGIEPFEVLRNDSGLAGVYDKSGNNIIPHNYRNIEPCWVYNMFFTAKDDENRKILDYKNNVIFEADYDGLDCSLECWCGVKTEKDGKFGMVNFEGKEVLKPLYDEIACQEHFGYSGGFYYIARKDNQYTVVSNKGDTMIPLQDKVLQPLSMHFFLFIDEETGKNGAVDMNGKVVIKPEYDLIHYNSEFYEHLKPYFTVCKDEKCGAVDENGKMFLPLKYGQEILKISDDFYIVGDSQNGMNIINKHGKVMTKFPHDRMARLNNFYAMFVDFGNDRGQGVVDVHGNEVMQPMEGVSVKLAKDNGIIKISKDRKFGIVYNNKVLTEPVNDKIYLKKETVMMLRSEDDGQYYYVASFDDFLKSEGKNLKRYMKNQFVKSDKEGCYKFKNDDGTQDYYCSKSEKPESVAFEY